MRPILMLLIAIALEIAGTSLMKYMITMGYAGSNAVILIFIFLSYYFLSKAVGVIPISTAYVLWEGIGLIATAFLAWLLFNEHMSVQKIIALTIILSGIIMVKNGTVKGGNTNG